MPSLACEAFATKDELYEVVCDGLTSPQDDELVEMALDDATDILVKAGGYRYFGPCPQTMRPCRECSFNGWCGCCEIDTISLPAETVSVEQVKIDGVIISPSTYEIRFLREGMSLVRIGVGDRPDRWPYCQKLWRPDTEEDTFSVTYTTGPPVSLVEKQAAIELAIAMIRATPNRGILAIAGADSVSGGGVVINRETGVDGVNDNIDDLPAVGFFRAKWNPYGDRIFSAGWSPEVGL